MANEKEILVKLLGLKADASDADILNSANTFQADMVQFKTEQDEKVKTLTNRTTKAEADFAAAKEAADAIALEAKGLAEELVNYDLEKFKDAVNNVDDVKAALLSNRAGTIAILKNIKVNNNSGARKEPLHNRATAAAPQDPTVGAKKELDEEKALAARISNRSQELSKTLGLSHQQAWVKAASEIARAAAE